MPQLCLWKEMLCHVGEEEEEEKEKEEDAVRM